MPWFESRRAHLASRLVEPNPCGGAASFAGTSSNLEGEGAVHPLRMDLPLLVRPVAGDPGRDGQRRVPESALQPRQLGLVLERDPGVGVPKGDRDGGRA